MGSWATGGVLARFDWITQIRRLAEPHIQKPLGFTKDTIVWYIDGLLYYVEYTRMHYCQGTVTGGSALNPSERAHHRRCNFAHKDRESPTCPPEAVVGCQWGRESYMRRNGATENSPDSLAGGEGTLGKLCGWGKVFAFHLSSLSAHGKGGLEGSTHQS